MTDEDTYESLKPIFYEALELIRGARGSRGPLWKNLPIEDLIALLHVKSERLRIDSKSDDALDAINYAAFLLWRLRREEQWATKRI